MYRHSYLRAIDRATNKEISAMDINKLEESYNSRFDKYISSEEFLEAITLFHRMKNHDHFTLSDYVQCILIDAEEAGFDPLEGYDKSLRYIVFASELLAKYDVSTFDREFETQEDFENDDS